MTLNDVMVVSLCQNLLSWLSEPTTSHELKLITVCDRDAAQWIEFYDF